MITGRERWTLFDSYLFSSEAGLDVAIKVTTPNGFEKPIETLGEDVPRMLALSAKSELTFNRLEVTVPKAVTKVRHSYQIAKNVSDATVSRFNKLLEEGTHGYDVSEVYKASVTKMPGHDHCHHGPLKSLSYAVDGYYMLGYDKYLDCIALDTVQEVSVQPAIMRDFSLSAKEYDELNLKQVTISNADHIYITSPKFTAKAVYPTGNREKALKARLFLQKLIEMKENQTAELLFELDVPTYKEIGSEIKGCNSLSINTSGVVYGVVFDKTDPRIIETPIRVAEEVNFPFADVFNLPTNKERNIAFYKCVLGADKFYLISHARGYSISAAGR